MAQEHLDDIDKAIDRAVTLRRNVMDEVAVPQRGLDQDSRFIALQNVIEALERARVDEAQRLP